MAGPTGLEPATSGVTGRRSNQLNYGPALFVSLETSATTYVCSDKLSAGQQMLVGGVGLEPATPCV